MPVKRFAPYRPFKQKYNQTKPKHQEQYYETYRAELTLYDAAERYIKANLNGRDKIPLPAWKAEREKLTADLKRLNREYALLKTDTAAALKIRSNVFDIMREESRDYSAQGRRTWSYSHYTGGRFLARRYAFFSGVLRNAQYDYTHKQMTF